MPDGYEDEPHCVIKRADGSTIRLYRSKTDPYASLPVQDDGTVVNWTERFSNHVRKK